MHDFAQANRQECEKTHAKVVCILFTLYATAVMLPVAVGYNKNIGANFENQTFNGKCGGGATGWLW